MKLITRGPFHGLVQNGYEVILADPPWKYSTRSEKGMDRNAENHYPTMTKAEILALPVAELAAKNCSLCLWITGPHLPWAFECFDAWGFDYSGILFSWAKLLSSVGPDRQLTGADLMSTEPGVCPWKMGNGHTSRKNIELCLLGRKGEPKRHDYGVRELIVAPLRDHSRKPDEQYPRIERLFGPVRRVELFTRTKHSGFDGWGKDAGTWIYDEHQERRERAITAALLEAAAGQAADLQGAAL